MIFGSLVPSIYYQFAPQAGKDTISIIAGSNWGITVLAGLVICIIGIIFCGKAGTLKEKELNAELTHQHSELGNAKLNSPQPVLVSGTVAADKGSRTALFEKVAVTAEAPPTLNAGQQSNAIEYKFALGLTLAIISGLLSACFNFGLEAGKPMATVANTLWKNAHPASGEFLFRNNVVYVVVLWGGLTFNFIYCMFLNAKHRSFGDYANKNTPLLKNYLLSALAGTTWFLQFFFYGMGESRLGNGASSWILHMTFIILVANMWGLISKEWSYVSRKAKRILFIGVSIMIASVLLVGYGNYLKP
ncbi:MAG: L-rhamnose/proton symporter RhaT [Flavisolibacter sp.]